MLIMRFMMMRMIMMRMIRVMMKMEGNHNRRPGVQLTSHVKDRRAPFWGLIIFIIIIFDHNDHHHNQTVSCTNHLNGCTTAADSADTADSTQFPPPFQRKAKNQEFSSLFLFNFPNDMHLRACTDDSGMGSLQCNLEYYTRLRSVKYTDERAAHRLRTVMF